MPAIKAAVLEIFRVSGGDLDRWDWRAARLMADALIRAEDMLEVASRGQMREERRELRIARRRLENAIPERYNQT